MKRVFIVTLIGIFLVSNVPAAQRPTTKNPISTKAPSAMGTRLLTWETYLDKVQDAWMGKMIGVTFGQPWEFRYQGVPIGFDITDWTLSPTHMKGYLE
jgi:hypothetical protein